MMPSTPVENRLRALIFDFDGTLLDSFPAHYRAYEVMMAHFGIEVTPEFYKQTYSPNWFAMYEQLGIPEERWEEADDYWLAEVRNHRPQLFPGTRPMLEDFRRQYILGLVTSGSRERVLRDLASTGIHDLFQVVVTGGHVVKPKPDPDGLLIALEQLKISSAEALYIGDTWEDCQMARAAGVPFVGIAREFATVNEAKECPQVADLKDLAPYIKSR